MKHRDRTFRITGLTWIKKTTFAWLDRNRHLRKDYQSGARVSQTPRDAAAMKSILQPIIPASAFHTGSQCAIASAAGANSIQSAIATIIRFSVSEMKPKGTLLLPPTHAHFSSRLSR